MASSSRQIRSPVQSQSHSPDVAISARTSPTKLAAICRQFQLEKNIARTEAQELRRKLADIANQEDLNAAGAPPTKRTRTNSNLDDGSDNEETQVINAGHRFVLLYSLWLRHGEDTFKLEYNPDLDKAERFENNENKIQGQLQEIWKILGSQLADDMSSEKWIAKAFMKGMGTQHSNTATRLRHQCAALFGVSESDMLHPDLWKEKFRSRIGWVDNGQGCGSYSSVDVEILHKGYTGSYNIKTAFLNPILMWVFVAIIRGPTSAKELMTGIQSNPKTETMARKHGIRNTTPGAIAGAVILSRWALSSNECLQSVGTNTSINYGKDFEEYLEILMTGLRKKKKSVLNVFREWDHLIFPNSDSSLAKHDQDMSTSGLKTAMMMLEEDEVEDEEVPGTLTETD